MSVVKPLSDEEIARVREALRGTYAARNRALRRGEAGQLLRDPYTTAGLTSMIGCYGMRKTFAHKVYATSGKDLFATQQAFGYASPGSAAAYLSLRQAELDAIILAL